jgi:hypothetical protein
VHEVQRGLEMDGSVHGAVIHFCVLCHVSMWCCARRRGYCTSEVLQELDFAQGTLGQDLLAEDIGDLLDGHALAGLVVGGSAVAHGQHLLHHAAGASYQTMPYAPCPSSLVTL